MKSIRLKLLALFLSAALFPACGSVLKSELPVSSVTSGVVVVGFSSSVSSKSDAQKVLSKYDLEIIQYLPAAQVASVKVPGGTETQWVGTLSQDPAIRYAELNHDVSPL